MKYQRNRYIMSINEQSELWDSCVIVVGCGGGGGTLAELLVRSGLGNLVLIDGDVYEESNQNRQIGCTESTIGKFKVEVLRDRFLDINKNIRVYTHKNFITKDNYKEILEPYFEKYKNVVISDTVDGYKNKKLMDEICRDLNTPHITGGDGYFMSWTSKIIHSKLEDYLPSDSDDQRIIYPAPTVVWLQASIQAQIVINTILKREWNMDDKRIFVNLLNFESSVSDPNES